MTDITKPQKTQSSWQKALSEYKQTNGKFIIPKKGSVEHAEITKLMEKIKLDTPFKENPKKKKTKVVVDQLKDETDVPEQETSVDDDEEVVKVIKVKRVKKSKKKTVDIKPIDIEECACS